MTAENFWIQLNYQLIHLIDFLPVANWSVHANDTAFIVFRDLYAFLSETGKIGAELAYAPAPESGRAEGEVQGLGAKLVSLLPVQMSEKMAAKSVRQFSKQIDGEMKAGKCIASRMACPRAILAVGCQQLIPRCAIRNVA